MINFPLKNSVHQGFPMDIRVYFFQIFLLEVKGKNMKIDKIIFVKGQGKLDVGKFFLQFRRKKNPNIER